jgi:hypothetical protein
MSTSPYGVSSSRATNASAADFQPETHAEQGKTAPLARLPQKSFSEMESEEPCDYNDHYDYADDVENIHRSAPIEECTICA